MYRTANNTKEEASLHSPVNLPHSVFSLYFSEFCVKRERTADRKRDGSKEK